MSRCSFITLTAAMTIPAVVIAATCSPRKGGRTDDNPTSQTVFVAGADDAPAGVEQLGALATADPKVSAAVGRCPSPITTAPPLGPVVGPACEQAAHASPPDPDLVKQIGEGAQVLAPGFDQMGNAFAAHAGGGGAPALARIVILQGPPHCYVVVTKCQGDAPHTVQVSSSGAAGAAGGGTVPDGIDQGSTVVAEGDGPALEFCPGSTGSYGIALEGKKGQTGSPQEALECAGVLFGD